MDRNEKTGGNAAAVKQNKMGTMPMGKLVANMSLPLMFSLLAQSLYNIVDSIFVSHYSEDALAATSFAFPVQILIISFSVGTAVGANAMISRALGAKRQQDANRAATTGMILELFVAALFLIAGLFFAEDLGLWFAGEGKEEIGKLSGTYLRICMCFSVGVFVETMAQRLLQATGRTFLSMVSLVVGAVVNIILDPIMIFGYLGFPEMGIAGAAVATVIGQWIGAAVALLLHAFRNPDLHFMIRGYRFSFRSAGEIYKVGLPTIVTQAMGSIMVSSVNGILRGMDGGATAVAFFGVYYRLQSFQNMPVSGLGQAAIPIAGYNFGAQNGKRIRELRKILLVTGISVALAATVIFLAIPGGLLSLFNASDAMKAIGEPALRIISLTFPLAAVTTVLGFLLSGLGNGLVNMIGTAIRQLVLLVPGILLLSRTGLKNSWYAFWIAEAAACIFAVLMSRYEFRKKVDPISG